MIWVQHDFYRNFTGSIKSNDFDLTLDIFRSELSDFLTYKSDEIYVLFKKLKIGYTKKESYEELLNKILNQIKKNEKFTKGIAFLIAENNNIIKNNPNNKWIKPVNKINETIKKINQYFIENPREEKRFKSQTLKMIELKYSVTGEGKRDIKNKDNSVLYFFVIVGIGVGIYYLLKYIQDKKDEKLKLESLNKKPLQDLTLNNGGLLDKLPAQITPQTDLSSQVTPIPKINDEFSVPSDVLLPESNVAQPLNNNGMNGVQINVQPLPNNNMNSASNINNGVVNNI
jgi:hypothetical protein